MKNISQNKRAFHDYQVLEKFQAGISLTGTEVKSCRGGKMSLSEAYVIIDQRGNAQLIGCNIAPYAMGSYNNHPPLRQRQLLLHKKELRKLKRAVEAKGLTIVPLEAYFDSRGYIKLNIGLCRGKNLHDKRDSMKEQMARREASRAMKGIRE